jgi:hypothetical protein
MMRYVVIRDDDISYFTRPGILEKLYHPLFEEKKAVNFSVIPNISAKIRIPANNAYRKLEQLEYDPAIPKGYRGCDRNFPFNENKEILDYIQSLDNCESAQHGFCHDFVDGLPEFSINNEREIQRRANLGREMLSKSLRTEVAFFIPPWDSLSMEALRILKSRYKGVSMGWMDPTLFDKYSWGSYLIKKLLRRNYRFWGNLLIVEHSGLLTRFNSPESIYSKVQKTLDSEKIVVLVNHHWEYFFDWNGLNQPFFRAWQRILEYLLNKEDLEFLSFTQLYELLSNRRI